MSNLIEISKDDYGYSIQVTLYTNDDTATAENLTAASSVSLDITRLDSTPLVNDATVTVSNATSGIVTFTPENSWFTVGALDGLSYYVGIFKITYASGQKSSFKMPIYVHQH